MLGVHRLHKDLASHIEVCVSCVGCPLTRQGPYHIQVCMSCVECPATTQGPCQSHRGVYVLCWVSTDYTRTLPVTSRCVCLMLGVLRLHKDLITSRCVCLVLGVHRLHKDPASHIEVCMSCVGCPLTTQGPYHIEAVSYTHLTLPTILRV